MEKFVLGYETAQNEVWVGVMTRIHSIAHGYSYKTWTARAL
ncbi:MAG: hypothetical protein ACOYMP_10645 [Nodosilinea sp.]